MRFNSNVILIVLFILSSLESKDLDYEKIYNQRCQACHGTIHQGDIGADLRENALKMKDPYRLSSSLIDGVQGVMPSFNKVFSKSEALDMVDWLISWEDNSSLTLEMNYVNRYRVGLADRLLLKKRYKKPVDVKSLDDIMFLTEREISLVTFIDATSGKVLSRHRSGYAVNGTIQNKKYPRYAYSLSLSGRLTMYDLMAPGQPAIAYIRVGEEVKSFAISNDGKYIMVGNYYPAGAVIIDAITLKAIKVFSNSSSKGTENKNFFSKVSAVSTTPYAPYFIVVLKDKGSVKIIDYSTSKFSVVGSIENLGKNLRDGFLNEDHGRDFGRYYMIASEIKGGDISVLDLKTKKMVKKIDLGEKSIPHTEKGASWYSKTLKRQLHASSDNGMGQVNIWDSSGKVIKKIKVSDKGLFVTTSDKTPYLWADCSSGKSENYNEVELINRESLEVERIIKVGKKKGQLLDAKSKKVLQEWDAQQYLPVKDKVIKSTMSKERLSLYQEGLGRKVKYPLSPKMFYIEPANHGKWTMISEWSTGRVGIYNSKNGEFIKYIYNLTTPTYLYSTEHRKTLFHFKN